MAKEFGAILKKLRFDRNLTQSEMAEATDLSLRFYQSLEGDESEPGLESIKKIINGLSLEPGEILGLPRKEAPSPTIESLLKALNELQKENERLKEILLKVPPEFFARLAVKSPNDPGARIAWAFLSGDVSQLKEPLLQGQLRAALGIAMEKTER